MTAVFFLGFLALVLGAVGSLAVHYLPRRAMLPMLAGLVAWLLYVGLLSRFGVVGNPTLRPPGIVFVVLPLLLFVFLFLARSAAGGRAALALPLWVILGMQTFRVGVEILLHQLYRDGLVPRLLTYEGGNVDILVGATAPFVAGLSFTGRIGTKPMVLWNILGLLSLANIVLRSALTAPGPLHLIHAEVANTAIGTFPSTYIAGFFAPLAIALHVLALRALKSRRLQKVTQ